MIKWLGKTSYSQTWDLQESTRNHMLKDPLHPGAIFLTEHPPTLTYGRGEDGSSFLNSRDWYIKQGFEIFETNRGGKLTYHGPGQLVVYPVIRLSSVKWGVKQYVWHLEECMIAICKQLGLEVSRREGFPGAWVQGKKIGSVGIHIRKQVSIHGFALNIHPDLTHFSWISPCGLENVSATSLAAETHRSWPIEDILQTSRIAILNTLISKETATSID